MDLLNLFMDSCRLTWKQICRNVFGLSYAVLDCSEKTTVDDFVNAILVDNERLDSETLSGSQTKNVSLVRLRPILRSYVVSYMAWFRFPC